MKRERRQQRQVEKKQQGQTSGAEFGGEPILSETESADGNEIEEVV